MGRALLLTTLALACRVALADDRPSTLDQLLAEEPPVFREGHTLPPLTRWGWTMPYEVRVELCERWGYALEFGGYVTQEVADKLDDPDSIESRLCVLTAADPKRYPLCVLTHRALDKPTGDSWCHTADGSLPDEKEIWSPEAPDEVFEESAARITAPLSKILERAPIAIVLNGGEYALSVEGHHAKYWERDPEVMAAKGDRSWFDYISERKAHQETIITRAVREAVPDRMLYLYYFTAGNSHRGRYGGWHTWSWDWERMQDVSDIPNSSVYYRHYNDGWTGGNDMLTQALNAVAQEIAVGKTLSYNWLCAGWVREDLGDQAVSDPEHYMGYLKCYYTAGMTGGVAGYFSYPRQEDPNWLWQMTLLSHCHALFSHLEDNLRNGDLLPGPGTHRWSDVQPAYEFPTGDPDARVLVRKHREREEWLVTAWAAGGEDRQVTVTIPDLGEVTVEARDCGSVYRATLDDGKPVLQRIDEDGMQPTIGMVPE